MPDFGRLTDFVNRGLNLDDTGLFFYVFSRDFVEEYIIYLNTEQQLFRGVDAKGVQLESIGGGYAASTIKRKQRKGQPSDRITLFDTGAFYSTFEVETFSDEFLIEAVYTKEGEDLRGRWGMDLAGLTPESMEKLRSFVLPDIQKFLLNYLLS